MKCYRLLPIVTLLLFGSALMAQSVSLTAVWDASATVGSPENPIKYRVYVSAQPPGGTPVTPYEAGTSLTYAVSFTTGNHYVWVTAYWFANMADGVPVGTDIAESGPSNVVNVKIQIPPGNPGNAKIRIGGGQDSQSGQTMQMRR